MNRKTSSTRHQSVGEPPVDARAAGDAGLRESTSGRPDAASTAHTKHLDGSELSMATVSHPNAPFENALIDAFPTRQDLQDIARVGFYDDFEPQVESYEAVTSAEFEEVQQFLTRHG